ncbi:MAG: BrnT family toxin [Pyrinomonadaceae bacterium]
MFVFEWDENKEKSNFRKHKVSFAEGESVFFDMLSITIPAPDHSLEENRFIDIGMSDKNRILVIVYTEREERIRIISVRKATKTEQKLYEQD